MDICLIAKKNCGFRILQAMASLLNKKIPQNYISFLTYCLMNLSNKFFSDLFNQRPYNDKTVW